MLVTTTTLHLLSCIHDLLTTINTNETFQFGNVRFRILGNFPRIVYWMLHTIFGDNVNLTDKVIILKYSTLSNISVRYNNVSLLYSTFIPNISLQHHLYICICVTWRFELFQRRALYKYLLLLL